MSEYKNMNYRKATLDDVPLLAKLNRMLTEDEDHRNQHKSEVWFEERMEKFLKGDYEAVLFEIEGDVAAYALYRNHPEHEDTVYLRQIFVCRNYRKQGIGRKSMEILLKEILPPKTRMTLDVLTHNETAIAFYKSIGFKEYSIEMEISSE